MADVFEDIKHAAREKKLLKIVYRGLLGEVTERVIEVYSIKRKHTDLLYGYDVAKNEIRSFILTGILETEVLEESFLPRWPIEI